MLCRSARTNTRHLVFRLDMRSISLYRPCSAQIPYVDGWHQRVNFTLNLVLSNAPRYVSEEIMDEVGIVIRSR